MTPVSGVTIFCSRAAAIVMSLPVEPGSKASQKARFARLLLDAAGSLESYVG